MARQIVLRQLAAAPRSRAQLAAALARRRCPADVAEAVLDRLAEAGLVDDTEFAHLLTRSQQAGRGLARAAVAHQLRRKGVNEDVVADVVAGITDAHDREQARRLVAKRMRSLHGLDATVQARRLGGMLARKGYPAGLALAVIREAVAGAPEHQRD